MNAAVAILYDRCGVSDFFATDLTDSGLSLAVFSNELQFQFIIVAKNSLAFNSRFVFLL